MPSPILKITDLSIGYPNKILARGINTTVAHGSFVILLGANGKGKSTLLKTIAGLIPARSGSVSIHGKTLSEYTLRELARTIAFLQASNHMIDGITVKELLSFARIPYKNWFQKTNLKDWDIIKNIANQTGITNLLEQTFETLSDGQKQKVNIARCLVQETPIILLDEPTAHLDIVNKQMVFSLLQSIAKQGKTIICTTHDLHDASEFSTHFWVIDKHGVFQDSQHDALNSKEDLIAQMF